MPPFNPFAGFSPICCAVLVQMEHCALEELLTIEKRRNADITNMFLTAQKY
jgi:hypothetical protein